MAREIATRLDLETQDEDRLFAAFADWWRELQQELDTDGDGRITGHEYAAASAALAGPALIRIAEVLFDVTDTDDDQTIDVRSTGLSSVRRSTTTRATTMMTGG
ncbi:hypothetical protein [Microbispora hainanensis]|uniref:hypothetical protein n=1 Tax=Microbispora hainanensis TaxID=568844 RepID=UPI003AF330FD